jgi:hypothetical protein
MRYTIKWKARYRTMTDIGGETVFTVTNEEGMLFALGLAAKARALVFGVPQICEALAKKKSVCKELMVL